ncbi:hypothetical protein TNCV_4566281 [Trichonephila clavipes]|nr:hypothetical protein TNCV_4566281 [Trichonephila clavipes]
MRRSNSASEFLRRRVLGEFEARRWSICRSNPSFGTFVKWKGNFQTGHVSLTGYPRGGIISLMDAAATVKEIEDFT